MPREGVIPTKRCPRKIVYPQNVTFRKAKRSERGKNIANGFTIPATVHWLVPMFSPESVCEATFGDPCGIFPDAVASFTLLALVQVGGVGIQPVDSRIRRLATRPFNSTCFGGERQSCIS